MLPLLFQLLLIYRDARDRERITVLARMAGNITAGGDWLVMAPIFFGLFGEGGGSWFISQKRHVCCSERVTCGTTKDTFARFSSIGRNELVPGAGKPCWGSMFMT